ncbi:MAG: MBL fold metallo-hydrolase, partial [Methanoregulaceae archaeon]|nr:MBL fold metallo-hydrolase [Methanoregulaceae archaeon]
MKSRLTRLICIVTALMLSIVLVSAGMTGMKLPKTPVTGSQPGDPILDFPGFTAVGRDSPYHTRLVLLGTAGGVTWYPDVDRAFASSALVVGDTVYLVDLGQGSAARLAEAFNTGDLARAAELGTPGISLPGFLAHTRALFITHLHMDHTADYPSLLLIGPGAGLGTAIDPATGKAIASPLQVFGPASRGRLEADRTGYTKRNGTIVYVDSANPALEIPTPGIRQLTCSTYEAFAQSINEMTLDNGLGDFTKLVEVHEIGGSAPGDIPIPVGVPDPNNETCPAMDPFEVYRDANVRVTAILVDHHQAFPAFAYRFDTADGSVVFSGDTGNDTNGNLERLADGADILVHEVIDPVWVDAMLP